MKRLIAILMAVVLLTSCRVLERSEYGEIAAGDVTMETQFAVYGRDTEVIQVILRNNSGEVLEFGSAWSMEVRYSSCIPAAYGPIRTILPAKYSGSTSPYSTSAKEMLS